MGRGLGTGNSCASYFRTYTDRHPHIGIRVMRMGIRSGTRTGCCQAIVFVHGVHPPSIGSTLRANPFQVQRRGRIPSPQSPRLRPAPLRRSPVSCIPGFLYSMCNMSTSLLVCSKFYGAQVALIGDHSFKRRPYPYECQPPRQSSRRA